MTTDLFGNAIEEKRINKSQQDDYSAYINSPAWKRLRAEKIKQAGEKCERCGKSKWSVNLEVHHKTYARFKRERLDDLEVLCPDCHAGADVQREVAKEEKRDKSPLCVGFENWMDRGNNMGWRGMEDRAMKGCWGQFLKSLSRKTGRDYDVPFKRLDSWRKR